MAINRWVKELEDEQEARIAAEEAARCAAMAKAELERIRSATPTVSEVVWDYIEKAKRGQAGTTDTGVEGSTVVDYNRTARKLEPAFSDVLITQLTPKMVKDWETEQLGAGMSANKLGKCHRILSAACKEACVIGLRLGEACWLRWGDVSFDQVGLYVRRSIAIEQGGTYVKEPKSAAGRRFVSFDSYLTINMIKRRRDYALDMLRIPPSNLYDVYVIGTPRRQVRLREPRRHQQAVGGPVRVMGPRRDARPPRDLP